MNRIKAKKAKGFRKPALFHKVMGILESQHYRLGARRFVIDLFDKRVMRQIVLDEDDESDSDEPDDDDNDDQEPST
jgi:rapamycin-insensitive companion of mTOR